MNYFKYRKLCARYLVVIIIIKTSGSVELAMTRARARSWLIAPEGAGLLLTSDASSARRRRSKRDARWLCQKGEVHLSTESEPAGGNAGMFLAGRPGRALADRAVDTVREQSVASQRGRPRQNRRRYRRVGRDARGANTHQAFGQSVDERVDGSRPDPVRS